MLVRSSNLGWSFTFTYHLTVGVVGLGAPQVTSQPVSSIFSLFFTALWDLANFRPVHSPMLSSHLLARPDEQETYPYHCSMSAEEINFVVGPKELLVATVEHSWFGHVTRHASLSQTIVLQPTLDGGRRRGQQRKCWVDITGGTSLPMPEQLKTASRRKDWKRFSAE